ncbi:MAG TPA: Gmad2 immunoglobulin-like domain-containing protein [Caulobacterales bacterium]|nr:Gmad2 immunoglobulin-like domain-containing protein [Caulobacterales bacterium]
MRLAPILVLGLLAACSRPTGTTAPPVKATVTTASAPVTTDGVVVRSPQAGARVTSPLVVTGTVPARWYFEAVFPARLEDASGKLIAEAPAQSQDDGTNGKPTHAFPAEFTFSVSADTPAFLVLQQNQSGEDNPAPQATRIPVTLAAH